MRRVLTEKMVSSSFRCAPQLGLVYLYNPKAGYRTIDGNLSKAARLRHDSEPVFVDNIFRHPLFGSAELRRMTCFSVVRNPFTRLLSGYLNKIVERTSPGVWRRFAAEHGLDEDASENRISFIDFLRIIETECDEIMNPHFRPQYLNLLMPFSRPQFIGRLENFAEVENFLAERDIPHVARKGTVTNASGRLEEFYTAEAETIVVRKYSDDFRLFGYSPRLSDVRTLLEPQWHADGPDLVTEWLSAGNFPIDQQDALARSYIQLLAENDREKRLEIIRRNFLQDDNSNRLTGYAERARQDGEHALADAVGQRLRAVENAWRERVDATAFVPAKKTAEADAKSARRVLRQEKRAKRRLPAEL